VQGKSKHKNTEKICIRWFKTQSNRFTTDNVLLVQMLDAQNKK